MKHIIYMLIFCSLYGCNNISNSAYVSNLDSISILISNDSTDINLLKERSKIYIENNQFDLAKIDIDQAYGLFKNDIDLLLTRGDIYYFLNQTRISKESWERCLKINPNQIECREKLTELLCIVRNPQCKLMIDTLSIINNGLISIPLIVSLKELGEYGLAIGFLKKLSSIRPRDKEILSLLSVIYSDTSMYNTYFNIELAENNFEKIIQLYPNDSQVYYNFGKHKQNMLEYADALSLYAQNLKLDTQNKHSYYNMGFCAMQLAEYSRAIKYFTNAISIDNSFLLAYHARAYLYTMLNNIDQANKDWKTCLMLNPSYIPALNALSK